MRIALCEDNEFDRDIAQDLLDRYSSERSIPFECTHYEYGMNFLHDMEEGAYFDIILLDIYMEEKVMGHDIAHKLRAMGYEGNIIFTTGTSEYAKDGFDVEADGYLVKPIDYEKFKRVMDKITRNAETAVYIIQQKFTTIKVPICEILFVESNDSKCVLHAASGEAHIVHKALTMIETELGDRRFLRCHKSFLVNMDYIKQFGKEFLLSSGDSIPIRQNDTKSVRDAFWAYTNSRPAARKKQTTAKTQMVTDMTLKDCYQQLGCDCTEVVSRLHTENDVTKKLIIFSRNPFYQRLSDALLAGDCNKAFRAAHTLKSDFHTMSFSHLYPSIDEMTEQLHAEHMEQALPLFQQLKPEYERTMVVLRQYLESIQ